MEVVRALLEVPPRTGEMTSEEEKARSDKWTQLYDKGQAIEEQMADMQKRHAEEDQRFESLLQACEADPSEWGRLSAALDQSSEERYTRTILYLTNADRRLGTVRAVFEVVGPLAFGISAIASGLLRG